MTAAVLRSVLRRSVKASSCFSSRSFASAPSQERKVAVLGAAGGIGQPLSLLMKLNPLVSRLALYDIAGTPGVAADVSHINTRSEVKGYAGDDQLGEALEGSDIVIIPAGVPRKPGMTRDDLFKINTGIVKSLCEAIAKYCPNALVNMISDPVNSTVPIAAEVFKINGGDNNEERSDTSSEMGEPMNSLVKKKKKVKKSIETYKIYIFKVLKQVHPDSGAAGGSRRWRRRLRWAAQQTAGSRGQL